MTDPTPTAPESAKFHHQAQGYTTKFWLLPDGSLFDTFGSFHFRWAQRHAGFLQKTHGIKLGELVHSDHEDEVRVCLVRQGMVRINHSARTNKIQIEGQRNAFNYRVTTTISELIVAKGEEICAAQVHLFDSDISTFQAYHVNLIGLFERGARQAHLRAKLGFLFPAPC